MNYRQLIAELKPIEHCILQDIKAPDLCSVEAAPYCGRRIMAIEYLPPYLRDRPEQTVWLRLEMPLFPDEALGLPLVPAEIETLRWYRLNHPGAGTHPWKVKLDSGNGCSVQIMVAPAHGRLRYGYQSELPGTRYGSQGERLLWDAAS